MVCLNVVLIGFYLVDSARGGTVTIEPSLRLGEQYDSNPFMTAEGGEINHDFITEISPQIALTGLAAKSRYSGLYRLDLRRYSNYRELNYTSHTATIAMDSDLSPKTSLSVGDTYRFTPDSREASDVGVQVPRNDILSNTVFATMRTMFGGGGSVSLTVSNAIQDFEDESLFDTRTDSASLSGSYVYSSKTSLTMSYGYADNHYENAVGDSDRVTHSAQLGVSNQLSPDSFISVSGGAVYTDDFDEDPNWTASANYAKTFQAASFNMGYSRSVTNSSGLTTEINIRDNVSMNLNRIFGRSFSANVGGSLLKNRSEPSNDVDRISYSATVGCLWRALEWLSIDARYSHYQQWVDDLLGVNMARDQVFIGFTATPGEVRF